jgi:hypothetical protein
MELLMWSVLTIIMIPAAILGAANAFPQQKFVM